MIDDSDPIDDAFIFKEDLRDFKNSQIIPFKKLPFKDRFYFQ
jgi:hypothetical protein